MIEMARLSDEKVVEIAAIVTENKALLEKLMELVDGKEKADTYSARPGHSEHQTGLAVDLNDPNVEGKRLDDKDYEWLLENAHKYGFIVRYQESYIPITGYMEETWHIRYVGSDIATKIHELDITYEEYYDLYIAEY